MKKTQGLGAALMVIAAARLVIACGNGDDSGTGDAADASSDATAKVDATSADGGSGSDGGAGGDGGGSGGDGGGSSADGSISDGGGGDGSALVDGAVHDAGDAGIFDASGFPPGLTACATCYADTCEPQAAACQADPYCEELFVCYVASGCQTETDPQTCITSCAADAGLTAKETVEASELLAAVATACTSCIAQCPKPDGGTP